MYSTRNSATSLLQAYVLTHKVKFDHIINQIMEDANIVFPIKNFSKFLDNKTNILTVEVWGLV